MINNLLTVSNEQFINKSHITLPSNARQQNTFIEYLLLSTLEELSGPVQIWSSSLLYSKVCPAHT